VYVDFRLGFRLIVRFLRSLSLLPQLHTNGSSHEAHCVDACSTNSVPATSAGLSVDSALCAWSSGCPVWLVCWRHHSEPLPRGVPLTVLWDASTGANYTTFVGDDMASTTSFLDANSSALLVLWRASHGPQMLSHFTYAPRTAPSLVSPPCALPAPVRYWSTFGLAGNIYVAQQSSLYLAQLPSQSGLNCSLTLLATLPPTRFPGIDNVATAHGYAALMSNDTTLVELIFGPDGSTVTQSSQAVPGYISTSVSYLQVRLLVSLFCTYAFGQLSTG
jgi:hypothetical protein